MTYLLIAFVIFLALAPLSHFVPSKRQRKIARMRERAALGGLFVEFRRPPEAVARLLDRRQPGEPIYYGKRLPPARNGKAAAAFWVRDEGQWRGVKHRNSLPDFLPTLPLDVFAASVDEGSCGVYWREQGEDSEVDLIEAALTVWAADLRAVDSDFS